MNKLYEDSIKKTTELALIQALPDAIIPQTKEGRLRGKCSKLRELTARELSKLPRLNNPDLKIINNKISKFGELTGWEGKQRHIVTLVSFLLSMIEESEFKYHHRITEILTDIFDYFDRVKDAKQICFVAGDIAHKKFRAILSEGL